MKLLTQSSFHKLNATIGQKLRQNWDFIKFGREQLNEVMKGAIQYKLWSTSIKILVTDCTYCSHASSPQYYSFTHIRLYPLHHIVNLFVLVISERYYSIFIYFGLSLTFIERNSLQLYTCNVKPLRNKAFENCANFNSIGVVWVNI